MRFFAAHMSSESGDDYYETFSSNETLTIKDVDNWLKSGDTPYDEEAEYMGCDAVWEIEEKTAIPIKVKK